jgi:hypothetical protein
VEFYLQSSCLFIAFWLLPRVQRYEVDLLYKFKIGEILRRLFYDCNYFFASLISKNITK